MTKNLLGERLSGARPAAPIAREEAEQTCFVEWFRWVYPKVRIMMSPNGAYLFGDYNRRAAQMARLKRMGLSPGVPDLLIPEWHLWLEFKRRLGGVVSDDQRAWHAYLRELGDTVIIARGAEAAIASVKAFREEV